MASRLSRLKRRFPGQSRKKFEAHVTSFKPDAVLCTHYLPLETLGEFKSNPSPRPRHRRRAAGAMPSPFVVSVVTDFEAHALWMDPCVDLYCVAAEETKGRLVARGAPADAVLATGIPIAVKFSKSPDPAPVRKHLVFVTTCRFYWS
jgi:processive 1,2-diacylglycerol beta-glucosyltransferase